MDWDKYINPSITTDITENNQLEEIPESSEKSSNVNLDGTHINDFINRLSGIDPVSGHPKATISYQAYDFDAPDTDINKQRVYQLLNTEIQISRNRRYNDLYTIDFIFKNSDDTELKLFWGRLQQHLKNQSRYSDKDWVFYINLLEKASVSLQTIENDTLLIGNIVNPIMFYLTREIPNLEVRDSWISNELIGGNIVRMIVSKGNLTFNLLNDIDTSSIKGEVQREEENSRYLDNYSES